MLLDLHDTSTRLLDDAGAITVPLLVLAAGSDWVVQQSAQQQFVERASSSVKQFEVLPGFSHAVFHEKERRRVVEKVRDFIRRTLRGAAFASSLLDARPTRRTRMTSTIVYAGRAVRGSLPHAG